MSQLLRNALCWLATVIVLSGMVAASAAGAAQVTRTSANRPLTGAAIVGASHVSLSLAANVVTPGAVTTISARVRPAAAGRLVFLRRQLHGHFINLKFARTNRRGVAIFRRVFSTTGAVVLRASVVADSNFLSATSVSAVENVDAELPFSLAPNTELAMGASGPQVLLLQKRLSGLGYWLGTPNGNFGIATQQAVFAFEKVAGLGRSGVVGAQFVTALNAGALPHPRTNAGDAIEVDLAHDLLLFVHNGTLQYVLNTSTGGGYTYVEDGVTEIATTPQGVYTIGRVVDGLVVDSLGALWRPRFFYEGFAIHGDSYVPADPVSHGCVRVSNEAIDWIWAENLAPVGMKVWVY